VRSKKSKQKQGLKSRLNQRMKMRNAFIIGTGTFMLTAVVLIIVNSTNPFSSKARNNDSIEVVKVSDQEFTNETTLEKPQIIQHKINGENTILIRERKNINAQ
jgi:hypothetical protein